jgi:hypothetical protein
MKSLQAACVVGAMAFTAMIAQVGGNTPGPAMPHARPHAAVSAETFAALALPPAGPETSAGSLAELGAELGTELGSVTGAIAGPLVMAKAETGDDAVDTRSLDLVHHDAAPPVPTMPGASDDAADAVPATQDFQYLINYVWSEIPPAEKPAEIVLNSLKNIPVGTPIEEIKRASDAFGLDFNYMKAVAKIESGFDPKQRTGSYIGLFQLSRYEFDRYGSGQILDPRDNAVAAAYKIITEGILFEWVTHKKPTLSDLYLIHQQGWEGAAEHISHPDRIAWKSMCATSEGVEKGEKWCKRAIWANTLPAVKQAWKSVDKLTSGAFVDMWRERVAYFQTKYMATASAAAEPVNP